MDDRHKKPAGTPQEAAAEGQEACTPASFEKRVAAWVGVVYVVMLLLATTCMIALGRPLTNVFTLLLPPGAVGVAIIAVYRQRHGKNKEGIYFTIALVFLCFIALALGLVCGIPNLLANFGIATPFLPAP